MNVSHLSNMFQKHTILQKNNLMQGAQNTQDAQKSTLQKIADKINQKEEKDLEFEQKVDSLDQDTYIKTEEPTGLEDLPTEALLIYRSMCRVVLGASDDALKLLNTFEEGLQQIDQKIQSYQSILAGESDIPEGASLQEIQTCLNQLQEKRTSYITQMGEYTNGFDPSYKQTEKEFSIFNAQIGYTPEEGEKPSDWKFNVEAENIYSEIHRMRGLFESKKGDVLDRFNTINTVLKEREAQSKYQKGVFFYQYRSPSEPSYILRKLEDEKLKENLFTTEVERIGENTNY